MQRLDSIILQFTDFVWGTPLLILLIGGGSFFMLYSRFIPFRYLKHGLDILMGKYDKDNAPGQISHFQALSSALASTVGMGNISGVAIAIHTGGPGALFWMWVCAFVGMATKFFTCSLAIMYRGVDDRGDSTGLGIKCIFGRHKRVSRIDWQSSYCTESGGVFHGAIAGAGTTILVKVSDDFIYRQLRWLLDGI